jgi:serine/threonine protein kinase
VVRSRSLEFEPRNRATDIYSLGCIIYEILLRLRDYRLSELKSHWKQTGNDYPSFSPSPEARYTWIAKLLYRIDVDSKDQVLLLFTEKLLNENRQLRPSAGQIVNKLEDFNRLISSGSFSFNGCCKSYAYDKYLVAFEDAGSKLILQRLDSYAGYALPSFSADYTYIILDFNLKVIARENISSIPTV